jgi:hypothetical protein
MVCLGFILSSLHGMVAWKATLTWWPMSVDKKQATDAVVHIMPLSLVH